MTSGKSLTKRECEIALLVAEGKSSATIGSELRLSQRTVDNHIGSIFRKLGMKSRAQLAVFVASGQPGPRPPRSPRFPKKGLEAR